MAKKKVVRKPVPKKVRVAMGKKGSKRAAVKRQRRKQAAEGKEVDHNFKSGFKFNSGKQAVFKQVGKNNLRLFIKNGWIKTLKSSSKMIIKEIMTHEGVGIRKAMDIAVRDGLRPTRAFVVEGREYEKTFYLQHRFGDKTVYYCVDVQEKNSEEIRKREYVGRQRRAKRTQ